MTTVTRDCYSSVGTPVTTVWTSGFVWRMQAVRSTSKFSSLSQDRSAARNSLVAVPVGGGRDRVQLIALRMT